jgi:hypothetical protein
LPNSRPFEASHSLAGCLIAAALAGCAGSPDLFPLEVGRSWTFSVRTGYVTYVEPVAVEREIAVAGARGYELVGPLGTMRLAWRGRVLLGERFANLIAAPPLPLLVDSVGAETRSWRGSLHTLDGTKRAEATLRQEPQKVRVANRDFDGVMASLSIRMEGRAIELMTWYAPGVGPVRQEQRTDGRLDVAMELLREGADADR